MMRRTGSASSITMDLDLELRLGKGELHQLSDHNNMELSDRDETIIGDLNHDPDHHMRFLTMGAVMPASTVGDSHYHHVLSNRTDEEYLIETPHFLRACSLCKSRLESEKDIYMYRGDTAFCSLECREQYIREEEGKDKSNKLVLSKSEGGR